MVTSAMLGEYLKKNNIEGLSPRETWLHISCCFQEIAKHHDPEKDAENYKRSMGLASCATIFSETLPFKPENKKTLNFMAGIFIFETMALLEQQQVHEACNANLISSFILKNLAEIQE